MGTKHSLKFDASNSLEKFPNLAHLGDAPRTDGDVAQLVTPGDVFVISFQKQGGARRGGVDKMAVQVAPFPGVSRPLAYIPEELSYASTPC